MKGAASNAKYGGVPCHVPIGGTPVAGVVHNTYSPPPTSAAGVGGAGAQIPPSVSPVHDWLQSLKLEQYIPLFASNDYLTLDDIVCLENRSLEILGVTSAKHRKQLMNSIETLRSQNTNFKQCANNANLIWSKDSAVHVIM